MKKQEIRQIVYSKYNGSRLCVVPMLKLTQNLIKGIKDGKFRNI